MPIDTSIPLQAKFTPVAYETPQPLNTLLGAMKLKQLGQESDEYERARAEEGDLRNYLATKPDLSNPEARTNLLGYGKTGAAYSKALNEQDTAALTRKETGFKVEKARKEFVAQAQRDTSQNPSDANITAYKEDLLANPLFSDAEKAQMAAGADRLLSMPVDQRRTIMSSQGASASELKPTITAQNLGGTTQLMSTPAFGGRSSVVPGSSQAVTMTPAEAARIKQEGARIGLEGRRVAVLEEEAKQKKDPAFQQQMAQAKATGEAIAKGNVAAQQALPGIIANATTAIDNIDSMIGKQAVKDASGKVIQQGTKAHPGFQDAVGATWKPGARFIDGTAASDFQTMQDQVEGAAFLSAFEALKGGGAISEKEGAKATAARLRMKLSQSESEYVRAAREFQDIVRQGVENAKSKAGAGGTIQPPAGGANIDALLDKYK